jgi:hypothetical protein
MIRIAMGVFVWACLGAPSYTFSQSTDSSFSPGLAGAADLNNDSLTKNSAEFHTPQELIEFDDGLAVEPTTGLTLNATCGACEDYVACDCCKKQKPCCACQKAKDKADALDAKVAGAHKGLFYNNDFSYLDDPQYDDWMPGDAFKRMNLNCLATIDVGGQYRMRHHSERNFRGLGLTGVDDDFLLHRTRLYGNAEVGDYFRFYGEMIDAESNYENFAPRAIEVNRSDVQNLFVDARLLENESGSLSARVGRQELLYGEQRTISPLDWANTRRTFEGAKLFWVGEDWNIDAFYTRPVITDPHNFDSPDYSQEFMGVYATLKAVEDQTVDFYYIGYNTPAFKFDTWGTRYFATREQWMFEVEGAAQTGDFSGLDHLTGATTIGVGRNLDDGFDWSPVLWTYYDYAGGDNTLGNGYHHLFPLSHRYLGFMDLFGRRNIESFNAQLTLQPHERVKLLAWYHYLWLENRNDTPYNVNMTAFNPANTPADSELGHEIDLLMTLTLHPRANLQVGYSHFFAGEYYELTPGVPHRGDADFWYTQAEFNF